MRIAAEQLGKHLEKGLQPLYVVHGDEPLLAIECADRVRTAARRAGYSEREVFTVESGFDWSALTMACNSLSLFASLRLLDVRIPSGKPGTEGSQRLQEFCVLLPADTVTLITLPKLDRQTQNSKWFTALENAGVTVPVYPVDRAKLPQWIAGRLSEQGQRAKPDTLQFLADQVEGNLLAAHQEVQKLALLFPAGEITFEQVKESVLDVARFDVFKLGDALLVGDVSRLVKMLQALKDEGEAPVLVLWALTQEIRLLLRIKIGLSRGQPQAKLMRDARVWESRQSLVERALKRLSEATLEKALVRAAELDRMTKGLASGDVWDELLQLGLQVVH
jgi:DNA polymerase-3 subunit delta